MYVPKHYSGKSQNEAIAFMRRFNFGAIVTSVNKVPVATHLPFVISQTGDKVIITSHFAKANDHWKHIEEHENLVIFAEPHAYISPKNYLKEENVPTWNYISVHAYGKAKIINDPAKVGEILEQMMNSFEPEYRQQWNSLSQEYKSKMMKGIVAFDLVVSRLQSKEKLSQNKKEIERKSIIESLGKSADSNGKLIAEYMRLKESGG